MTDPREQSTKIIPIFAREQTGMNITGQMTEILRVCRRLEETGTPREKVALDLYERLLRHFRP